VVYAAAARRDGAASEIRARRAMRGSGACAPHMARSVLPLCCYADMHVDYFSLRFCHTLFLFHAMRYIRRHAAFSPALA